MKTRKSKKFTLKEAEVSLFRFIAPYIMHQCWVSYQMGCGQKWNINPTDWQIESLMDAVEAFEKNPDITPQDNHINWCKHKFAHGWKWGKIKDVKKKIHPCLKPFNKLPRVEQMKDVMNLEARRFSKRMANMLAR